MFRRESKGEPEAGSRHTDAENSFMDTSSASRLDQSSASIADDSFDSKLRDLPSDPPSSGVQVKQEPDEEGHAMEDDVDVR